MATEKAAEQLTLLKESAERIREELRAAKRGGYYGDAWYFYLRRVDVERLVNAFLGPDTQ